MNNISQHEEFYKIITSFRSYQIGASNIEVNKDSEKLEKIKNLGFSIENLHDNDIILLKNNFKIFNSIESFLNYNKISNVDNILILDNNRQLSFIQNKTYINFKEKEDNHFFTNCISFLSFLKKLKELEDEIDSSFHFVDSYNRDSRKITFVSIAEKSRLTIIYENKLPFFDEKNDYNIGFKNFEKCFENENKNLARFLKTATINTVINYDSQKRLQLFFENLNSIVYKAKVNFEVYLNELSLDKIKKEYDDVKTKYFNNLSDVLSKLTTSILALPIAIATLLFSIEKVKEIQEYLYILIAVILVTSFFISSLLRINFKDLIFTNKLLDKDYNTLIENNFFTKFEEEKETFNEVKDRIIERICYLKLIIESYFWVMNISNIVIIGIILKHLNLTTVQIIIPALLLLLGVGLFRNYIFEKES